jgi:hypothetical protein
LVNVKLMIQKSCTGQYTDFLKLIIVYESIPY